MGSAQVCSFPAQETTREGPLAIPAASSRAYSEGFGLEGRRQPDPTGAYLKVKTPGSGVGFPGVLSVGSPPPC